MQADAARARALVEDVHAGEPWHGYSTRKILEGVTARQAAVRPPGGAHSIWEIVLHMTGWTREVAARLLGAQPADPAGGDWPDPGPPTDTRWMDALRDLDTAQDDLRAAVERVPDDRWSQRYGTPNQALGTGKTCLEMLEGLAVHHGYHAGQISLLKRVISERPS